MTFPSFHIPRCLVLIGCLHATSLIGPLNAADQFSLTVVTDRESALYEVGEQAAFLITVRDGDQWVDQGTVSYAVDNFLSEGELAGLPEGELSLSRDAASVVVTGDRPGFLRCQVTFVPTGGKPIQAVASAGFSPTKILPSLSVPDDFDQFWADQKRRLAEIPADATLSPVDQADESIECYDVQVPCLGDAPVSGYLTRPKGAESKSLPAILGVHGGGVRSSSLPNAVKGALAGMLSLDINAHGLPNGKPDAFYAEASSGPLQNYRYAGREHQVKLASVEFAK